MGSRFGVLVAQTCSWEELAAQAKDVEQAGYDSLWVADQFANPFASTDWLEGWTALAGIATVTERIRLGTLVSNIIYRHPGLLVKQAITVDKMSNGRLELGLGAGGAPSDHTMTGTSYWSGPERQRRFAEYVAIVEQLLTTRESSFSGEFYSFENTYISPGPVQSPHLPLVIAAHGPKSIKLAAERADKWSFFEPAPGLKGREAAAEIRKMNAYIDEKAAAAGRDPGRIVRSFCCGFSASSSWQSIDQALSDIALYEDAGVNEFILNYSASEAFGVDARVEGLGSEIDVSLFLQSRQDLDDFLSAATAER
jgi:alkanesulfonate monooxygenase SsuD/methylene tetrahydromethanopterin reductase-like flavin-dependent oxidoreductase (luciferase family)